MFGSELDVGRIRSAERLDVVGKEYFGYASNDGCGYL